MRRLSIEAELVGPGYRLITTKQLDLSGYDPSKIARRLKSDGLVRILRGVYSVGPPESVYLTRAMALCLRYPEGFISGAAASYYWGLRRGVPDLYEFSVPERCRPRGIPWVLVHYVSDDREDVVETLDGLGVSTAARCVFEAAGRLDQFALRSMIQSGLQRKAFTADELQEVGSRLCSPGRRGTRLFRSVIENIPDEPPVHTEAELTMLDAVRAAGLNGQPQYPLRLASGRTLHLDVGIPETQMDLEIDGNSHDDPIVIHRDKDRDMRVSAEGWQPMRIPEDDAKRRTKHVMSLVLRTYEQRAKLLKPTG